jgi:dihydroxyacetone kinase-like protein
MTDALDLTYWRAALARLTQTFETEHARLCALDGAIGDGDHGTSMVLGFREASRALAATEVTEPSALLRQIGAAFTARVGGVTGILVGAVFSAFGTAADGKQTLGAADLAAMADAAVAAVRARGKAEEGQKSLLDALAPAARALREAAAQEAAPRAALQEAAAAAAAGAEATRDMVARVGRARYQGERSLGHVDAGAASVALLYRVLADG